MTPAAGNREMLIPVTVAAGTSPDSFADGRSEAVLEGTDDSVERPKFGATGNDAARSGGNGTCFESSLGEGTGRSVRAPAEEVLTPRLDSAMALASGLYDPDNGTSIPVESCTFWRATENCGRTESSGF